MNRQPPYYFVQNQINNQRLSEIVFQSIKQKDREFQLYNNLLDQSTDAFITSFLSYAQTYEAKMKGKLEAFYIENFGPIPNYLISPEEVTPPTYIDGLHNALLYNAQSIVFEREVLEILNEEDLGNDLFEYLLVTDMDQQSFLNTVHAHYLHYYE